MKTLVLLSYLALCLGTAYAQSNALSCSFCHSTAGTCTQKTGYVTCSCMPGYAGDGITCSLISSCTTDTCCSKGYTWDNRVGYKVCTDVNECSNSTLNSCVPSSTCTNKVGTYLCGNNRTVACPTTACSFDQDCLNVGGVATCADPCSYYSVLNGTQRLSTINSTGVFSSDQSNIGWFRYTGTTGLRMQQGCVGSLKCGSAEPYTVNGSHPAIGAGVVMMNLMANTVTGCAAAGTIPVKACTGGYYVYKFTGSLSSEVYCTDPAGFVVPTMPPTTTTPKTTTKPPTTTTPTTTTPTTTPTTTKATTTLLTTTTARTTTAPTTPAKTTPPQQNITVTTLITSKVISVTSTVTGLNGTNLSILEFNETLSVFMEVKTISPSSIMTNSNNSVAPSYTRITTGAGNPVTFTNMPAPQVSGNSTVVPNLQPFQSNMFVSMPPQTKTLSETSTINNNNVTSTTITTTITTKEINVKV